MAPTGAPSGTTKSSPASGVSAFFEPFGEAALALAGGAGGLARELTSARASALTTSSSCFSTEPVLLSAGAALGAGLAELRGNGGSGSPSEADSPSLRSSASSSSPLRRRSGGLDSASRRPSSEPST